jgi:hypothetical protein
MESPIEWYGRLSRGEKIAFVSALIGGVGLLLVIRSRSANAGSAQASINPDSVAMGLPTATVPVSSPSTVITNPPPAANPSTFTPWQGFGQPGHLGIVGAAIGQTSSVWKLEPSGHPDFVMNFIPTAEGQGWISGKEEPGGDPVTISNDQIFHFAVGGGAATSVMAHRLAQQTSILAPSSSPVPPRRPLVEAQTGWASA